MEFNSLNTMSEKILHLFLTRNMHLSLQQVAVLIGKDYVALAEYFSILLDKGYIKNSGIEKTDDHQLYMNDYYKITTAGKIYFDMKHKENIKYYKRSVFIPGGVAIVVSFITTLLTLWLKTFQ